MPLISLKNAGEVDNLKLHLVGHEYKYAVEQIMLMLFPDERPEYDEPDSGVSAVIKLSFGKKYAAACTRLFYGGGKFDGSSRVSREKLCDKLSTDRLLQKIIKLSFYKAASAAIGYEPVWGALTGIRPGKIITQMVAQGMSENQAERALIKEYRVSLDRAALCSDTARAALTVQNSLAPRDVALYIGIPFCPTRCAYCSFVSHSVEKSIKLIDPFLAALFLEIDGTAAIVQETGLSVVSVYIGGGTPTTLSESQLSALIEKLSASFDLSHVREYTVEAGRPDTITPEKLSAIKKGGATRISVNPQSMSNAVLSTIGRRHTAEDVYTAVASAQKVGFECINMDVIAGLPADSVAGFKNTLDEVLSLSPGNITVHTLSLKKGSRIMLEKTTVPSANDVSAMLDYASETLRRAGYAPYYLYRQKFTSGGFENVGWSRPGLESFYNICMMEELCTILALGGGGATKFVAPGSGKIERVFNPKYPYEYNDNIRKIIANKSAIKAFFERNTF